MFTEKDSRQQDVAFEELKENFHRLEQQEKILRKNMGLSENDPIQLDESELTPEVREALEEAKAKAQREGAARAAQFQSSTKSNSTHLSGGRRHGVLRI